MSKPKPAEYILIRYIGEFNVPIVAARFVSLDEAKEFGKKLKGEICAAYKLEWNKRS